MELKELEMFLAVVEERSVNRAAERVCRTQPAVSIALQKLETELGVCLLHRPRRRSFQLTRAGQLVYEYASRMVTLRDEALSALKGPTVGVTGRLLLGVSEELVGQIAAMLEGFRQQNPAVRVELVMDLANRLLLDVAERKLDLAVVPQSVPSVRMSPNSVAVAVESNGASLWVVRCQGMLGTPANRFVELLSSPTEAVRVRSHAKSQKDRAAPVRRSKVA
jgi:DNA-binding transcriptional LysR family regulator